MKDGLEGGTGDGLASPFIAVVPVRRWLFVLLALTLAIGGRFPSFVLDKAALVHFGQWGVLTRARSERGRLRWTLVFVSVFDGEVDQYIVTFSSLLPVRFAQVFGFCVGFPGPLPSRPLLQYIDRHKHASQFFFTAYGPRTMSDIRAALWIRDRMAELAAEAPHLDAARLRARLEGLAAQRDRDARIVYRTPKTTLTWQALKRDFGSVSFTTMAPIIAGRERQVVEHLERLQADPAAHEAFAALANTHHARFAVIEPDSDEAGPAKLLFSAQFDRTGAPEGEVPRYTAELFDQVKKFAVDPWQDCEGYPAGGPRRLFVDYLRLGAVPTGIYVAAVTATAPEIIEAVAVEERFEALRAAHLDAPSSDAALLAEFHSAVGSPG